MKRSTRYLFCTLLWLLNLPLMLGGVVYVLAAALNLLPMGGEAPIMSWKDWHFWLALGTGAGLIAMPAWFCIVFTRHQQAMADFDEGLGKKKG
ncbi:MAG: hypothetical protein IJS32_02695 [Kiritimatiellae bacterium]|jgi:hypothetical protein|nr:hypothetical protein [Kiritimatiellia bacterium]